jgi:hypothetical protein
MTDRWEYNWCDLDLENGLVGDPRSPNRETIAERGSRGWEMVTILSIPDSVQPRFVVFFKRRVVDTPR